MTGKEFGWNVIHETLGGLKEGNNQDHEVKYITGLNKYRNSYKSNKKIS